MRPASAKRAFTRRKIFFIKYLIRSEEKILEVIYMSWSGAVATHSYIRLAKDRRN